MEIQWFCKHVGATGMRLLRELIGGEPRFLGCLHRGWDLNETRLSDTVKHSQPLYTVSANGCNSTWVFADTKAGIKAACKITPNGFVWVELHFMEHVRTVCDFSVCQNMFVRVWCLYTGLLQWKNGLKATTALCCCWAKSLIIFPFWSRRVFLRDKLGGVCVDLSWLISC